MDLVKTSPIPLFYDIGPDTHEPPSIDYTESTMKAALKLQEVAVSAHSMSHELSLLFGLWEFAWSGRHRTPADQVRENS